jgi:hypothetical protein
LSGIPGFSRTRPGRGFDRPYYDVQGATIHGHLRCVILADDVFRGTTHFIAEARRHVPCSGDPQSCHYCKNGIGKRRKGYVAAITTSSRIKFVLELTDKALNSLEGEYNTRGTLRGLRIRVERKANRQGVRTRHAAVLVTVEGSEEPDTLPPAFQEEPHLAKMWGLLDEPQPARVELAHDLAGDLAEGEVPL